MNLLQFVAVDFIGIIISAALCYKVTVALFWFVLLFFLSFVTCWLIVIVIVIMVIRLLALISLDCVGIVILYLIVVVIIKIRKNIAL